MAYKSFWKCVIFTTLILFVSTASGEHVCTRKLYQRLSTQTSISESYSQAYGSSKACGWAGLQRCRITKYRPAYTTAYKTVYYYQAYDQDYCCSGYSGTAPHCLRVCPSLSLSVSNGKVIITSTLDGGTASYSCNPRYEVDGAAVLTCQSSGSWSSQVPTCRRIRVCPVLDGIADGAVNKTDEEFAGSEASYSCSYGYGMVGGSTLTCMSSGEWNGSPPECYKLIMCPRLDDPTNGIATLENHTNGVGSLVSYRCLAGYALVGSDSRTCQLNGLWTHSDPQCKRICPTLSVPHNGYMTVSDYFVGGTANFACHVGFGMSGSGQIICEADGLWNQQPPVCDPVCSVPTKPDNGIIVSDEPYFIESNAIFTCEEGFGVNGDGNITCLSDLIWSGSSPTCDRVCGPLKQVLNGALTVDSYFYNAEATYQCNEGFIFKFPGSQTEIITFCCVHAENSDHLLEWVGDHDDVSDCEPIECSTRRLRLINGTFTVTLSSYGGIVTYVCFDGYILTGPRTRTCSKDGKWEPRINPFCTAEPNTESPEDNPE